MGTALAWLRRRSGRRGAFLFFLATLDVLYGWSLLGFILPGYHLFAPTWVWGWVWICAGVAIAPGVLIRHDRIPFSIAAGIKGLWAALYAHVWLVQHGPRAWVATVIWLLFALIVVMIAGWPDQVLVVVDHRERES